MGETEEEPHADTERGGGAGVGPGQTEAGHEEDGGCEVEAGHRGPGAWVWAV